MNIHENYEEIDNVENRIHQISTNLQLLEENTSSLRYSAQIIYKK